MNARQMHAWKNIVRSCKSQAFSSINVASEKRSDAILAADALVELVTLELASLLDDLSAGCDHSAWIAAEKGWALAARIREALEGDWDTSNERGR